MKPVGSWLVTILVWFVFVWKIVTANKDENDNHHQRIPLINIESWTNDDDDANHKNYNEEAKIQVVQAVEMACREIGFFAIVGHAVPTTVIERVWKSSQEFFDLPLSQKLAYKTNNEREYPYGYEHSERLERGRRRRSRQRDNNVVDKGTTSKNNNYGADLKETFSIGPSNPKAGMPERRIPTQPVDFSRALQEYYAAMETLALTILRIFAVALKLPKDWFEDKMTHHMSALRILNYYAVNASAIQQLAEDGGIIRASAHTDYGPLTILLSGGPGLQVQQNKQQQNVEEDESWIDVPDLPLHAFIINLGDLMQRWTNDEWVSTLHRVVIPKSFYQNATQNTIIERRQSIAYFCNLNGDAIVEPMGNSPPKYPPITAKEHLMAKHLASMSSHDEL